VSRVLGWVHGAVPRWLPPLPWSAGGEAGGSVVGALASLLAWWAAGVAVFTVTPLACVLAATRAWVTLLRLALRVGIQTLAFVFSWPAQFVMMLQVEDRRQHHQHRTHRGHHHRLQS
jgi:hypothetical protein